MAAEKTRNNTNLEQLDDPDLYLNRELSLLEFQRRVLEEAQDDTNPLLERVRFISIFGSNMDEFFMVRVSGIAKQVEARYLEISPDGRTPAEALAEIRKTSMELFDLALDLVYKKLLPALGKTGIHLIDYEKLSSAQRRRADEYFHRVVYPVLTPLAFDPGHPFPHISNLSLNLAVVIRDPKGNERFARVKVPSTLPNLVPVKHSSGGVRRDGTVPYHHYFVWLEQVITANLGAMFPGMEVVEIHPFRIIRDADVEIQELEAEDLLESMQQSIRKRRFGSVVQVAILDSMPSYIRQLLLENLEIGQNDLFVLRSPLGLSSLSQLYSSVERHDLKFPLYKPRVPIIFKDIQIAGDFFDRIREQNIFLHHPYDSFEPVIDFLNAAARDPQVLAIKQTLYRVGQNSPVVGALLEASERGKQVAVLVELKARFDEASNIEWARTLEQAGVHVVYGLLGLKTHSKVALVIRREGDGIRRYMHLATGNYNAVTTRAYEDMGIFTCDEQIGTDATDLFNYLTGYSTKEDYQKLLVAPVNLRQKLEQLIEREITHARKGRGAHLIFKFNSLADIRMSQLLYRASRAGVKIDLLVRGICCLRPGIKGISDNITVRSVVGRYLEHSRIYYFYNDGSDEMYLGSADMMPRNLDRRVEVLFPLENAAHVRYLRDNVLDAYLKDTLRTRVLRPNGTYSRVSRDGKEARLDVQEWLMEHRPGSMNRVG
ncbi:MAG: polyphosphate kinase 1 [Anaerolineales bacterium]|nr:polyphosphate kinase 1 [Anaerolineales bacterium]